MNNEDWKDGDIITAEKLNNMDDGIFELNLGYEKINWKTGDLITAEKLNHMEQGIVDASEDKTSGDVRFLDYDGTVVKAYTADAFAELPAFPANPSHEGLVAQGWNWTFEDAKAYVAKYGMLDIGQMYITDDGATRLYIHIASDARMDVPLNFGQTVANGVTINWGDGSATETVAGTGTKTLTHTYAAVGDYMISLLPAEGCTLSLGDGNMAVIAGIDATLSTHTYTALLQVANVGKNTSLNRRALADCYSLVKLTIPEDSIIEGASMYGCPSLASLIIPRGTTGVQALSLGGCYSLARVSLPKNIISIANSGFSGDASLTRLAIPEGITELPNFAFGNCASLVAVVIPDSITVIGADSFSECKALKRITIPNGITGILPNAFKNCFVLESIVMPDGPTYIGDNTFNGCNSLIFVSLPETITRINTMAFNECNSLASITIPGAVTNIGSMAFLSCTFLGAIRFEATTPPTVSSDTFMMIPTDCKIYVPAASLEAYKAATNYPDPATYTYIGY